jgi:hypothetical protein
MSFVVHDHPVSDFRITISEAGFKTPCFSGEGCLFETRVFKALLYRLDDERPWGYLLEWFILLG